MKAGPDSGRCNRYKCIGQKNIADACIGQISKANNEKHHFLRTHGSRCINFNKVAFSLKWVLNIFQICIWNIFLTRIRSHSRLWYIPRAAAMFKNLLHVIPLYQKWVPYLNSEFIFDFECFRKCTSFAFVFKTSCVHVAAETLTWWRIKHVTTRSSIPEPLRRQVRCNIPIKVDNAHILFQKKEHWHLSLSVCTILSSIYFKPLVTKSLLHVKVHHCHEPMHPTNIFQLKSFF